MPEHQNIEYKQSWRDEYLKWVCGFANAQGGRIYIGIDDKGKVTGVDDYKKLMDDLELQLKIGDFSILPFSLFPTASLRSA